DPSIVFADLGMELEKPSSVMADQLGITKGTGLVVHSVRARSEVEKAGLKVGDVLLEVNSKEVPDNVEAAAKLIRESKTKDPLELLVLRKGKKETIKVAAPS